MRQIVLAVMIRLIDNNFSNIRNTSAGNSVIIDNMEFIAGHLIPPDCGVITKAQIPRRVSRQAGIISYAADPALILSLAHLDTIERAKDRSLKAALVFLHVLVGRDLRLDGIQFFLRQYQAVSGRQPQKKPDFRKAFGRLIDVPKLVLAFWSAAKHRPALLVRKRWAYDMAPYRRPKIAIFVHKDAVKAKTTHGISVISAKEPNTRPVDEINLQFGFIGGFCNGLAKAFQVVPRHAFGLTAKRGNIRKLRVGRPTSDRRPYQIIDRRHRFARPPMGHKASPPLGAVVEWHERIPRLVLYADSLYSHYFAFLKRFWASGVAKTFWASASIMG